MQESSINNHCQKWQKTKKLFSNYYMELCTCNQTDSEWYNCTKETDECGCCHEQTLITCKTRCREKVTELCGYLNFTAIRKCEWYDGRTWNWMIKDNNTWIKTGPYCGTKYNPCNCEEIENTTIAYACSDKVPGTSCPESTKATLTSASNLLPTSTTTSTTRFTSPCTFTSPTNTISATTYSGIPTLTVERKIKDYTGIKLYASATTISLSSLEQEADLQVDLPADLFSRLDPTLTNNTVTFTFTVNNTPPASQTTEGRLVNIIFGVEVVNITLSNLSTPFNMSFKQTYDQTGNATCVYLNQTGSWVPDGCHTLTLPEHVVCSCNHFSLFTLMIPGLVPSKEHAQILRTLSIVGGAISAFFCALTLLTHCLQHASQATDKVMVIHLQLVGSLLLLNLLLLASMSLAWEDSLLCKVLGGLLHYALLTCFSWMGLEALHLYRLLVQVYNTHTKHYLLKISLLGWGLSGVVVTVVAGIWTPYGLKGDMCWMTSDVVLYCSVLAYLIVVLFFNGGMFIFIMSTMCRMRSGISPLQKTRNNRAVCSVLGLTCILGLTWGLGFFSIGYTNYVILYTFTILNSLQGFFLFLWICIKRRREGKEHRKYVVRSQATLTSEPKVNN